MKVYTYILSVAVLMGSAMVACTDDWDNHYSKHEAVINNEEMQIVNSSAVDFLESESTYHSMYELFEKTGVLEQMNSQDLFYTIFVVNNDSFQNPEEGLTKNEDEGASDRMNYVANGHITTASLSPSLLKDGQRLLMWNGKYVDVSLIPVEEGGIGEATFSGCGIKKVTKVNNGYIYELDHMINNPQSMLEVIEGLDDDYSHFKELVLSRNVKVFDKEASVPVGVDNSGNTIYDSVFVVSNPYFSSKGMDLTSESMKATMFIPSDELVDKALADAKRKLASWQLERPDSILENWCFQAMFFEDEYKPEDFDNLEDEDIFSIFEKQWRTTVQKVDLDNPITMSNGTAYYVTDLKIPTKDVLIWRFKDLLKYFKYLTPEDKAKYFIYDPAIVNDTKGTRTEVKPWSPGQGWPEVSNEYVWFYRQSEDITEMDITVVPFKFNLHEDNTYDIEPYLIPPGEYTFHTGMGKYSKINYSMTFSINDVEVNTFSPSQMKGLNHDRGGGGYPEFFPSKLDTRYDRDGTEIGKITIEGDAAQPIRIKFHAFNMQSGDVNLEFWTLRPTEDNY